MSQLMWWLLLLGPVVGFSLGWAFGYGYGRRKDAKLVAELETLVRIGERNEESLREQIVRMRRRPMSDDDFDRVLDEYLAGTPDRVPAPADDAS